MLNFYIAMKVIGTIVKIIWKVFTFPVKLIWYTMPF